MKNATSTLGFVAFFLALSTLSLYAQPAQLELHGCHYMPVDHEFLPLTPLEAAAYAQNEERSDTLDILHFDIDLEVVNYIQGVISGRCGVRFTPKMNNVDHIRLDLLDFTVSGVNLDGNSTLFDFDEIEIKDATDEEVERFIVQVGNDTDAWRLERYSKVVCTVCSL